MNAPTAPSGPSPTQKYFIGLGIGVIPVLPAWISGGFLFNTSPSGNSAIGSYFLFAAIGLSVVELIVMIVLLTNARLRPIGYGLLTLLLISPIVDVVGCLTIGPRITG
jgi:hypothetical protein